MVLVLATTDLIFHLCLKTLTFTDAGIRFNIATVPSGNPINQHGNTRFQELHNTVIFFRTIWGYMIPSEIVIDNTRDHKMGIINWNFCLQVFFLLWTFCLRFVSNVSGVGWFLNFQTRITRMSIISNISVTRFLF